MRFHYFFKTIQRRTYDILSNRNSLFCFIAFFIVLPIMLLVMLEKVLWIWNNHQVIYLFNSDYGLMIDKTGSLSICDNQPIDVVYTWVNGSDPKFLKNLLTVKRDYLSKYGPQANCSVPVHCSSGNPVIYFKTPLVAIDSRADLTGLDLITNQRSEIIKAELYDINYRVINLNNEEQKNLERYFQLNHESNQQIKPIYVRINCSDFTSPATFEESSLIESFISSSVIYLSTLASSLPPRKQLVKSLSDQERTFVKSIVYHQSRRVALIVVETPSELHHNQLIKKLQSIYDQRYNVSLSFNVRLLIGDEEINQCQDDSIAESLTVNRFADNDEFKYSLRSLEKFAPWIRNVYLVTNGQIPNWINLNHPKLRLITHEEIFPNKNDLPTFNSAAIECHLHRIPDLSEKFLYFNDDMLFGKPVYLDDFYSPSFGYRVYLAWPVPNCEPGCPTSWLKDGFCDQVCNTSLCLYDGGDCLSNSSSVQATRTGHLYRSGSVSLPSTRSISNQCKPSCADFWLGDKYCDIVCNTKECGFDMGDCGLDSYHQLAGQSYEPDQLSYHFPASNAIYLNLTNLMNHSSFTLKRAVYEKDDKIRATTLNTKHKILTILFIANTTDISVPVNITYTVNNVTTDLTLQLIVSNQYNFQTKPITEATTKLTKASSIYASVTTIPDYLDGPKPINELSQFIRKNSNFTQILEKMKTLENINSTSVDETIQLTSTENIIKLLENIKESNEHRSLGMFRWETDESFVKLARLIANYEKYEINGHESQRHLLDKFSDSLKYVNHLYNQVFGIKARKIVAHSAILVDKAIIGRLWKTFPNQLEATSSHKLRSSDDMQFSFSYFNFLISETKPVDIEQTFKLFDTDNSGTLSGNELRSLIANLEQLPIQNEVWFNYSSCWNNSDLNDIQQNDIELSFGDLSKCQLIVNKVSEQYSDQPRNSFHLTGDSEIAFTMIKPNATRLMWKLDSLRRDPKKFLCFNDDIDDNNENPKEIEQVRLILKDYYNYLVPKPSSFELSENQTNQFSDIQSYRERSRVEIYKSQEPGQWICYFLFGSVLSWLTFKMLIIFIKFFRRLFWASKVSNICKV